MPSIMVRDPTLVERLRKLQPVPDDYFDGAIYELLRRAERAESKPKLSGLDNLPQLIVEEVRKALDGQLVEALKSALLPAVGNLDIEIPVNLSIKVRVRLEPVLELSHDSTPNNHDPPAAGGNNPLSAPVAVGDILSDKTKRTLELAALEQRVLEFLKSQGGCYEGSVGELLSVLGIQDPKRSLRYRLYNRLRVGGGRVCLPEAAVK